MPLPLIPIILGGIGAATAIGGLFKGWGAKKNFDSAKEKINTAQENHQQAVDAFDIKNKETQKDLADLGKLKIKTLATEIKKFVDAHSFFQKVVIKGTDLNLGVNLELTPKDLIEMKDTSVSAAETLTMGFSGVTAGALAGMGVYGSVQLLGAASTGAAISGLSGVAATNATMAWLGGGALSAGGLGMAGGTVVLGSIVAGPALLVTGYVLASKSEEALTEAQNYEAEVDKNIAKIDAMKIILDAIVARSNEFKGIIRKIASNLAIYNGKLEELSSNVVMREKNKIKNEIEKNKHKLANDKIDIQKKKQRILFSTFVLTAILTLICYGVGKVCFSTFSSSILYAIIPILLIVSYLIKRNQLVNKETMLLENEKALLEYEVTQRNDNYPVDISKLNVANIITTDEQQIIYSARIIAKGLKTVIEVPLLNKNGELSEESQVVLTNAKLLTGQING